jgi:RimJ/RimL family protein N-acetyltransferase
MKRMGTSFWPLFDLELHTPRLSLRVPRDEDLPGLIDAIDAGIHPPEEMPFAMAWTDQEPVARARSTLQHFWSKRAAWSPESWDLMLGVFVEGVPIGVQHVHAKDFVLLRAVDTGSWLTMAEQGKGYGKEMRTAALHLAFEELGATRAESGAFLDNASSAAVSRALGYRENGVEWHAPRGEPRVVQRFLLTLDDWRARPRYCPVTVAGLDRESFGVD